MNTISSFENSIIWFFFLSLPCTHITLQWCFQFKWAPRRLKGAAWCFGTWSAKDAEAQASRCPCYTMSPLWQKLIWLKILWITNLLSGKSISLLALCYEYSCEWVLRNWISFFSNFIIELSKYNWDPNTLFICFLASANSKEPKVACVSHLVWRYRFYVLICIKNFIYSCNDNMAVHLANPLKKGRWWGNFFQFRIDNDFVLCIEKDRHGGDNKSMQKVWLFESK